MVSIYFNIFSDIDECTINTHNCDRDPGQATCTNTIGSFTCACNTGFAGNGVICTGQFIQSITFKVLVKFAQTYHFKRREFHFT